MRVDSVTRGSGIGELTADRGASIGRCLPIVISEDGTALAREDTPDFKECAAEFFASKRHRPASIMVSGAGGPH
jgi:hypothetical protein